MKTRAPARRGSGLLLWMQKVYGDKAPEAWQKLAAKTVTVTKGWSEAYGLFLKGESDLVLSYTTSPAYHVIEEKKDNYAAAAFTEGHYLQVEVAAKTAASKQQKLADEFLNFMVSPAFQNAIPTGNWMYPVTQVTLPEGFNSLVKPQTALEFTPQQVATERQNWINAWLRQPAANSTLAVPRAHGHRVDGGRRPGGVSGAVAERARIFVVGTAQ
ncbi:thiamine ABC transporter substrate-binding protein [Escherichia coli]